MKWWPWRRKPDAPPATEAVKRAQRRLDDAHRKDAEVNWLAEQLRAIRDSDALADELAAVFRRRHP